MKNFVLIIIFFLSGCSIWGPSYSGETTASALLKFDTERGINTYFRALHQCSPEKIHTQITGVKLAAETVEQAQETWTVLGCGKTEIFNIQYTSDGSGGTYINMKKLTN